MHAGTCFGMRSVSRLTAVSFGIPNWTDWLTLPSVKIMVAGAYIALVESYSWKLLSTLHLETYYKAHFHLIGAIYLFFLFLKIFLVNSVFLVISGCSEDDYERLCKEPNSWLERLLLPSGLKTPGPSCSNLTTSLVNISLKFQTLISKIW